MSAAARPLGRGGSSSLLNMNMRRKNMQDDGGAGPSTTQSEPPPSPHLAYFDKYPKRAERLQQQKHVTIEFPTIPERKSATPRHAGGLRDWRVVQAHLEPRVGPRKDNTQPRRRDKDKEREKDGAKIRDPDDMVIVSLAGSPSPTSSSLPPTSPAFSDTSTPTERTPTSSQAGPSHEAPRRRPAKTPNSPVSAPATPSSSVFARAPPSPSLASGFRSSLISSAGTLASSATTDAAPTPPRTPTSPHDPVLIASSSVEAMDALIEGMGSNSSLDNVSFLSPSFGRTSRFGYPLYQPPLPTPPDGVKLGIVHEPEEPWRTQSGRKNPKPTDKEKHLEAGWAKRYEEDYDETETETDASALPSRRTPTTSTSTFASTSGAAKSAVARHSSSSASSAPPSRTSTPADNYPIPPFDRSITSTTITSAATTTTPPIRIRSDEEIEAEERADVTSPLVPPVRVRQRSGLSVRSAMSGRSRAAGSIRTISTSSTGSSVHRARGLARSPGMWDLSNASSTTDLMETDGTMDAIIKNHVSRTGEERPKKIVVPSIDEIIRMHSPAVVAANQAASKSASRNGSVPSTPISGPAQSLAGSSSLSISDATGTNTPQMSTPGHSRSASRDDAEPDISRSSVDSIADEAQRALQVLQEQEAAAANLPRRRASVGKASSVGGVPTSLKHARSFPKARASSVQGETSASASLSPYLRSPLSDGASICSGNSGNTVVLPPSLGRAATTGSTPVVGDNTLEMAQYLRSPRLTRLLTLRRPANAGLTVSLADVGSLTGRPVIVYLGLGCVRYLVALYDEMAEALNLRLICVDRWGLGRTTDVPTDRRGLLEWAGVVEEVADTLGLGRYSVLAHSAGAPYALASSLKAGDRLFGSVHLLAPWVSMAVDGGYKWLKYVPNGVIKTAQAAEWKFQGWMIGKPPTIQYEGIGFDATAPMSGDGSEELERPSFSSFDELDDFEGRFASRSTLAHAPVKDEDPEKEDKKDKDKKGGRPRQVSSKSASGDRIEDNIDRPRKGSKIFGGLFSNTLPKNGVKRGMSTPPSAIATPTPTPAPPPPIPPIPVPPSPPTPTGRPQKLKGLRSMSSLKAHSTKSEPAKSKDRNTHGTGVGLGLGMDSEDLEADAEAEARTQAWASEFGGDLDGSRPRQRRSLSLTARPSTAGGKLGTPGAPNSPRSPCPPTPTKTVTLASALLQASHAESLKGGTADLLSILERDSKPWGFSYADVRQPVRVWYGDRDDKIGIGSVRWMERVMKACDVKIVKGAGHSLMTNAEVVVEVLESIAREWDESS
ncbi:hypothetical protein RhiJN_25569 [Ceratobasidium sp. AG-Ba]|nr:hypothetical protein RhiJN_25569 [Ceratobasidium sp. AG-Ba]